MGIQLSLLFISATHLFGLPPNLLNSLCYVESHHNPSAIHLDDGGANSVGVCQVKLSTAQNLGFKGGEAQLLDPNVNIYYAAKYLSHQIHRYHGSIPRALIAYNQGSAKDLISTKYSDKVINEWRQQNERRRQTRPK